jgi:hypothetical protein
MSSTLKAAGLLHIRSAKAAARGKIKAIPLPVPLPLESYGQLHSVNQTWQWEILYK